MMKLKEIHRTSMFAWSPFASLLLLATGTVAGALDECFSNGQVGSGTGMAVCQRTLHRYSHMLTNSISTPH